MSRLQKVQSHHISEVLLAKLKEAFRPRPVTPGTKMEQIMYNAGEQNVVEFIERFIK